MGLGLITSTANFMAERKGGCSDLKAFTSRLARASHGQEYNILFHKGPSNIAEIVYHNFSSALRFQQLLPGEHPISFYRSFLLCPVPGSKQV